MRALLATVALLAVAFAGCSEDPAPDETADASETEQETGRTTRADSAEPRAVPPVRAKAEPVPGTELDFLFRIRVNGDASGLEWSLDADGDGKADAGGGSLPAEVVHAYAAAGTYDAVVRVFDGDAFRDVTLRVEVTESVVLTGTTTVISGPHKQETGHRDCVGFHAGENGMDCIWFPLDGMDGWRFVASNDGPLAPSADLEFLTTCDALSTQSLGMHVRNAEGWVPDGAGCALLWAFGANTATLTLTLTPQHDS